MAKRGHKGKKKLQGSKAKKVQSQAKSKVKVKAKARKTNNKAVKSNLKKMTFDNSKKIELLNADVTKVYTGPPKPKQKQQAGSSQTVVRRKSEDEEMPDVSGVIDNLEKM